MVKEKIIEKIDEMQDGLWELCTALYENPETAFHEHQSSSLLTDQLHQAGFQVERNLGGLETAFRAAFPSKEAKPAVALLAEYDALPGLGHACGHQLIAAAALGAAVALSAVIPGLPGRVEVIGTPAEESGGGKRLLVEAGIFAGIDAAMMFHPGSKNMVLRGSLASTLLKLEYHGKASHAAAAPEKGINALEACIATFNNVNAIRQQLQTRDRVAGIIKNGGEAANVIPDYASAHFSIRGETKHRRDVVAKRVIECAEAGALATGCRLEYTLYPGYAEMVPNRHIAGLFGENLRRLDRKTEAPAPDEPMGSTDMGDVSLVLPALHAYLATAPSGTAMHTIEFREVCASPAGKLAMLDAAKALAMTTLDLLSEPGNLAQAREELEGYLSG